MWYFLRVLSVVFLLVLGIGIFDVLGSRTGTMLALAFYKCGPGSIRSRRDICVDRVFWFSTRLERSQFFSGYSAHKQVSVLLFNG